MLPELSPADISGAETLVDSGVGVTAGVGVGTVVGVGVGTVVGVDVGTTVGVGVGATVGVGAAVGTVVGFGAGVTYADASAITISGVGLVEGVSAAIAGDSESMGAGSSIVTANPTKLHIVTTAEIPDKIKRFLKGFFRKIFTNAINIKTGIQIRAIKKTSANKVFINVPLFLKF